MSNPSAGPTSTAAPTSTSQTVPEQSAARRTPVPGRDEPQPTGWTGWIAFASVMMVMVGSFHVIAGFVGIFKDDYYVVPSANLMVTVDYTTWGWVHLIGGLVVAGAGLALMTGHMWARIVAVLVAFGSAVVNLAFMSAFPLWSTIMIAIDVLVIWAVTVHGREMQSI